MSIIANKTKGTKIIWWIIAITIIFSIVAVPLLAVLA